MKTKDQIHKLIKSLTPAEKRYFISNHANNSSKQKNYIRLFKAIDKQKEYNEAAIRMKFKGEPFTNQLWVAKNYLYKSILKSLIQYKGESTRIGWFTTEINKFEVLYNKALYQEAYELSTQLKKQLAEREMYAELLMVISMEIPLIKYVRSSGELTYPRINGKMEALHYLSLLTNFIQYESLNSQFYEVFVKRSGISASQQEIFNPILSDVLIQEEALAITERSKRIRFFIKAVCAKLSGEIDEAYFYSKKLLQSTLDYPETLDSPNSLPLAAYNHIIIMFEQPKPDLEEIQSCLQILNDQKRYDPNTLRFALEKYYLASFRLIECTGKTSQMNCLIQELHSFIEDNNVGDPFENRSLYALGMMCFFKKDYKQAFNYAIRLLNKNKNLVEDDYLIFAHIMRLICAFELNYIDGLPSYFRSTYRFLNHSTVESKAVDLLLKLIKTQFQSFTSSDKQLKALTESYKAFNQRELNHFEKPYLYLSAWVSSKLNGSDFLVEYRKKNAWSY